MTGRRHSCGVSRRSPACWSIRSPRSPPKPAATSNADGKLHARDLGFFADDCTIEVRAPGYRTERFPVGGVCTDRYLGSCLSVEILAVLSPDAP